MLEIFWRLLIISYEYHATIDKNIFFTNISEIVVSPSFM
jgi:hypothetical protein